MKILLSAYSCRPCKTSEPGNAWRAINHALSQGHEVWAVIEQSEYQKDTLEHLAKHPLPGFHPVFFQLPTLLVKSIRGSGMSITFTIICGNTSCCGWPQSFSGKLVSTWRTTSPLAGIGRPAG